MKNRSCTKEFKDQIIEVSKDYKHNNFNKKNNLVVEKEIEIAELKKENLSLEKENAILRQIISILI